MLYLESEACNPEHAATLQCPSCGCQNSLRPHGWYVRGLVDVLCDLTIVETVIEIRRVICKECHKTHALIPTTLVPYRPFTVRLFLLILQWCLLPHKGASAAAEALHASLSTVWSARSDAGRVAETLRCATELLAEVIAEEAADAAADFALRFATEHGTAPFSRIALPSAGGWPDVDGAATPPQHSIDDIFRPDPP